jgi:ORF6N domain
VVAYLVVLQFRRFLRVDIVDEVASAERAHASTRRHAAAFITMSMNPGSQALVSRIRALRGHKVLLVSELAALYEVPVKALVQAVKRNPGRFPSDFMFHLTEQEVRALRSQIVTLNEGNARPRGRGTHLRFIPYALTEQGVAMLSSVLKSERAIRVNVEIMRAFVRLRGLIGHNRELAQRLDALESKYDRQFKVVFDAIRELMAPPATPKRRIGFVSDG